jgi:Ca2+-binding EF-hand superfamily protein
MKMMTMILSLLMVSQVLLFCATPKMLSAFSDWDTDANSRIERNEFVQAYVRQGYFKKWGQSQSISYVQLADELFASLDVDKTTTISPVEFTAQIKQFYFGLFQESFRQWDDNNDGSLSKQEFTTHASSSKLPTLWDNNVDQRISEQEMAGGMFYLCDANGDGFVDDAELIAWKEDR